MAVMAEIPTNLKTRGRRSAPIRLPTAGRVSGLRLDYQVLNLVHLERAGRTTVRGALTRELRDLRAATFRIND